MDMHPGPEAEGAAPRRRGPRAADGTARGSVAGPLPAAVTLLERRLLQLRASLEVLESLAEAGHEADIAWHRQEIAAREHALEAMGESARVVR
jgi:hypothetical protein